VTLLAIVAIAGISVFFYTKTFARIYLGELLAGLNLGPLAIVGACVAQAATISLASIAIGIAPGIMIANVLYLNEIPDVEADAAGGRKNLPILLGRQRATQLYAVLEALAVAWIPTAVVLRLVPWPTIVALASLPFAIRAINISRRQFSTPNGMVPALGANVTAAYLTIGLSAVGYVLSIALRL
jgi:1,4-dihydroxy-2-naphthoate octaprenyltransferase